jgi:membrane protein
MKLFTEYFEVITGYLKNQFNHAAALAYYSLFAIIPLAFVSFSIFGRIIGQATVEEMMQKFLTNQVGLKDTSEIMEFIINSQFAKPNIWMEILSVLAILISTSAMTSFVKRGINDILKVPMKKRKSVDFIKSVIQFRVFSLLAIAVFMMTMIVLYFSQIVLVSFLDIYFSDESFLFQLVLFLLSTGVSGLSYFLVFYGVYNFGHDTKIETKKVLNAALFSSMILLSSQFAIKYYLQHFFVFKDAGLTGAILVLLTWIYFTSHILFMGAYSIHLKEKLAVSN